MKIFTSTAIFFNFFFIFFYLFCSSNITYHYTAHNWFGPFDFPFTQWRKKFEYSASSWAKTTCRFWGVGLLIKFLRLGDFFFSSHHVAGKWKYTLNIQKCYFQFFIIGYTATFDLFYEMFCCFWRVFLSNLVSSKLLTSFLFLCHSSVQSNTNLAGVLWIAIAALRQLCK